MSYCFNNNGESNGKAIPAMGGDGTSKYTRTPYFRNSPTTTNQLLRFESDSSSGSGEESQEMITFSGNFSFFWKF